MSMCLPAWSLQCTAMHMRHEQAKAMIPVQACHVLSVLLDTC